MSGDASRIWARGTAATLAPAAIIVVFALLVLWGQSRLSETTRAINHSHRVIEAAERTLSSLRDAETGQRGFLLTGQPRYLEPYDAALARLDAERGVLRRLTRDDAVQQARLDTLDGFVAEKLAELAETVRLRRFGSAEEALAVVRTDRGKRTMDGVRGVVGRMIASEERLLARREGAERRRRSVVFALLLGGGLLAGAATYLIGSTLGRTVLAQEALGRQLAARNHELQLQNAQLQTAAEELEMQGEELQSQTEQLESKAVELEEANEELARSGAAAEEARGEAVHSAALLDTLFRSAPIALAFFDRELRFVRVNDRMAAINGVPADAHPGRLLADVLPVQSPRVLRHLQRVVDTGEPLQRQIVGEMPGSGDARRIWAVAYAPVRDAAGAITGVAAVVEDVTERTRHEAELEAARSEAEAANVAKSQFLATMSHELRTPLNAIAGYVELIEIGIHGPVTPAQLAALERVRINQKHLLSLIQDILNFAKLEAGRIEFDLRPVSIAEVVEGLEALMQPQIRARGLDYRLDACSPGLRALADEERVLQILLNVVGNAVKFTEPGGSIAIGCVPAGDQVRVFVRDTGRGIPAERMEHVFDPFVQVDRHRTEGSQQGVGLGLAIGRELARAMGGDLTAVSAPGVGSTFTLSLPAA